MMKNQCVPFFLLFLAACEFRDPDESQHRYGPDSLEVPWVAEFRADEAGKVFFVGSVNGQEFRIPHDNGLTWKPGEVRSARKSGDGDLLIKRHFYWHDEKLINTSQLKLLKLEQGTYESFSIIIAAKRLTNTNRSVDVGNDSFLNTYRQEKLGEYSSFNAEDKLWYSPAISSFASPAYLQNSGMEGETYHLIDQSDALTPSGNPVLIRCGSDKNLNAKKCRTTFSWSSEWMVILDLSKLDLVTANKFYPSLIERINTYYGEN